MPLYEYRCRHCDHAFERIEKASAPSETVCPICGDLARRMLGIPALQFKGSGWYVNDYGKNHDRGGAAANAETTPQKPTSGASDGASGGTETAPNTTS